MQSWQIETRLQTRSDYFLSIIFSVNLYLDWLFGLENERK